MRRLGSAAFLILGITPPIFKASFGDFFAAGAALHPICKA
jgi:hypothetical protein